MQIKTCTKCGVEKPYSSFGNNKNHRDGLQYNCKQCMEDRRKANLDRTAALAGKADAVRRAGRTCIPDSFSLEPTIPFYEEARRLTRELGMIQVAEQIKHMREDWKSVAQGNRRTKVDIFDQDDRDEDRRIRDEQIAERQRQTEARSSQGDD